MDTLTYTLEIKGITHTDADAVREFLTTYGHVGPGGALPPFPFDEDYEYYESQASFGSGGESKGYPRDAVAELSGYYPDALFIMEGRGHDEDCFRSYFKTGQVQEAGREVRYDPFDPARLTPFTPLVGRWG